jgi:hypothetical protein
MARNRRQLPSAALAFVVPQRPPQRRTPRPQVRIRWASPMSQTKADIDRRLPHLREPTARYAVDRYGSPHALEEGMYLAARARKLGYAIHQSRSLSIHEDNLGKYALAKEDSNYVVLGEQQRCRHLDGERFGGCQINDRLELHRRWPCAFEDSIEVVSAQPPLNIKIEA